MSIETEPVTEEQDKRKRRAGAWLRIGIAGVAVFGIGAGLTVASWTDFVGVNMKGTGDAEAYALWVRTHQAGAEKPGEPGSTWKKSVDLNLGGNVRPDKKYTFPVDVYNASAEAAVVEFKVVTATVGSDPWNIEAITSIPSGSIAGGYTETYWITVDTATLPPSAAGKDIVINATYTGTYED